MYAREKINILGSSQQDYEENLCYFRGQELNRDLNNMWSSHAEWDRFYEIKQTNKKNQWAEKGKSLLKDLK